MAERFADTLGYTVDTFRSLARGSLRPISFEHRIPSLYADMTARDLLQWRSTDDKGTRSRRN